MVEGVIDERDAAPPSKVFGIRSRIERADRHHKAQNINRGHLTTTPDMTERNLLMECDQPRIGGADRLRAHVVLLHPQEPLVLQGRDTFLDKSVEW